MEKHRVGQVALSAWPVESLARMLLAQVLTARLNLWTKKVCMALFLLFSRRPDSGHPSWRMGLRQKTPNSICLSKWKLHPGLWSLINCLDMKSVQKQPHAHMQNRAEGIPKSIQQVGTAAPAHISVWEGKLLILCCLHHLLAFFMEIRRLRHSS